MTRRPTIRCQYTDGILSCPAPGTIRRSADGEAILWAGGGHWAIDIPKVAGELATARRVLVVSRAPGTVRRQIQALWSAEDKAARAAAAVPAVVKPERPKAERCGQPGRNGAPCRQAAGWATDTPGVGPCAWHGGSTVQKAAEADRFAENVEKVAEAAKRGRAGVLTRVERLEGEIALLELMKVRLRRQKRGRH